MPGLGAATYYSWIRSVPVNETTFLEPYNMQLWEDLLRINGLSFRLMHYAKDIRANFAVCNCGQKDTAGSVAVIRCFSSIFAMGKMAVLKPNPYIL